jgi:hypothetical protein
MKLSPIIFAVSIFASNAYASKIGDKVGKAIFLGWQKIENVGNTWSGIAINDRKETGQARVLILGTGSNADFYGVLSINCENSKFEWYPAVNFRETADATKIVPKEIESTAISWFCKH